MTTACNFAANPLTKTWENGTKVANPRHPANPNVVRTHYVDALNSPMGLHPLSVYMPESFPNLFSGELLPPLC